MDTVVKKQLAILERRVRTLTGIILGVAAFLAAYSLMLYEGLTDRPGIHFYPWLLGVVFYLAGDMLAWVWFKVVAMSMAAMLAEQERKAKREEAAEVEPEELPAVDKAGGVEIIRPGEPGE